MKTETKRVKGFKYRIYPTPVQKEVLEYNFNATRSAFNYLLDKAIKEYEAWKKDPENLSKPKCSGYDFSKQLPIMKAEPELAWLKEASSNALQQKTLDLGKAFSNFFRDKKGYPNFKSMHANQSIRLTGNAFRLKDNEFYIAKLDTPIQVKWSRMLPDKPSSATVSRNTAGQYFVSFVCEYIPAPTNGQTISGIDLTIENLAVRIKTDEDTIIIDNPQHYVKKQRKLAKLQRKLAKKQKGSKNREKAKVKVAKLHRSIANQRLDYLHKLSTKLVRENQAICLEDKSLIPQCRDEETSKNTHDAGWGMFKQMLTYKAEDSSWCRVLLARPVDVETDKAEEFRRLTIEHREKTWEDQPGKVIPI